MKTKHVSSFPPASSVAVCLACPLPLGEVLKFDSPGSLCGAWCSVRFRFGEGFSGPCLSARRFVLLVGPAVPTTLVDARNAPKVQHRPPVTGSASDCFRPALRQRPRSFSSCLPTVPAWLPSVFKLRFEARAFLPTRRCHIRAVGFHQPPAFVLTVKAGTAFFPPPPHPRLCVWTDAPCERALFSRGFLSLTRNVVPNAR